MPALELLSQIITGVNKFLLVITQLALGTLLWQQQMIKTEDIILITDAYFQRTF